MLVLVLVLLLVLVPELVLVPLVLVVIVIVIVMIVLVLLLELVQHVLGWVCWVACGEWGGGAVRLVLPPCVGGRACVRRCKAITTPILPAPPRAHMRTRTRALSRTQPHPKHHTPRILCTYSACLHITSPHIHTKKNPMQNQPNNTHKTLKQT